MFPKRPKRDDEDTDAWLITYADMVTLLLCFFIIMFSMSTPNTTKFKKVAEALREEGFYTSIVPKEDAYEDLRQQFQLSLGASGYDKYMFVSETKDSVEVELSSTSFFQSGQAKFTRAALPMLKLMSEQILPLAKEEVTIEVQGHTDDSEKPSAQYPTSWELSTARASNVVRYLIAQGFPKDRLVAVGFAETQPKAPNRDATGTPIPANQDLNRRVVVKMKKLADPDV